jgi:hypothetical protein
LRPWEWWIGDGAYIANEQFLSPFRNPVNGQLPIHNLYVNAIISHYRARVEHINHLFEMHAVFAGRFRGGISLLSDSYFVIAHTTNIGLRRNWRYPAYGPWSHI